jgi:2,3-dihydroxy-p-cumate/2,3-dihydroxybenzoate 3,4-dioxygenase
MIELEQLRYVRLVADNLDSAAEYAERVLGLEPIDRNQELATFRSDFRDYTLAFATSDRAVQSVGLEVRYPRDLEAALEGFRGLGLSAGRGSAEDCALRKVKDMALSMDRLFAHFLSD